MKKLKEELKKEGYPEETIENTISKIEKFDSEIKRLFYEWLENSTVPGAEIENYSYEKLTKDFQMKPIGAFITLDWLKRDPKEAKKALEKGIQ